LNKNIKRIVFSEDDIRIEFNIFSAWAFDELRKQLGDSNFISV
jgi:hypothetical protein